MGASPAVSTVEHELYARDAYLSVVALGLLLFLWEALILGFGAAPPVPWFQRLQLFQMLLAVAGLIYFLRTWRHPRLDVAITFALIGVIPLLVEIPWGATAYTAIGRPWDAIVATQLAIAAMPLVAPRYLWLGGVLIGLFSVEMIGVFLYEQHHGFSLPPAEPYTSLTITVVAVAVLLQREQRRRLGVEHIRAESAAATLRGLGPLFAGVSQQLRSQLAVLAENLGRIGSARGASTMGRAVERLSILIQDLGDLRVGPAPEPPDVASPRGGPDRDVSAAEQLLIAKDAQLGALIFAFGGLGVALLVLWAFHSLPLGSTFLAVGAVATISAASAVYLCLTRGRPKEWRGLIVSVVVFVTTGLATAYVHLRWSEVNPLPYIGHKLMLAGMMIIGPRRLWLGVLIVLLLGAEAITLGILLNRRAGAPLGSSVEPWVTIVFVALALFFLVMGEQRRVASVQLLRAQAEASYLRRRATLYLAMCDQLNSPLQVLVTGIAVLHCLEPAPAGLAEMQSQVDRLRTISRDLMQQATELVSHEHHVVSLDAKQVLHGHS